MKPAFIITGRPRSRTAWVANLLTVPPASFCFHEGLADSELDIARLRERMEQLPTRTVGTADTGLIHNIDLMLATFPEARVVLMVNNEASWRRWTKVAGWLRDVIDADYARAQEALRDRAYFCDCLAVTYDIEEARRLWDYCIPDEDFEPARWELLRDLNVQADLGSLRRRYRGVQP